MGHFLRFRVVPPKRSCCSWSSEPLLGSGLVCFKGGVGPGGASGIVRLVTRYLSKGPAVGVLGRSVGEVFRVVLLVGGGRFGLRLREGRGVTFGGGIGLVGGAGASRRLTCCFPRLLGKRSMRSAVVLSSSGMVRRRDLFLLAFSSAATAGPGFSLCQTVVKVHHASFHVP